MFPSLIGRKIGMTQIFDEDGVVHPITVVQAGPCVVLQLKTAERDGYEAVQIGFEDAKPARVTKPLSGHCAAAKSGAKRFIHEVRQVGGPVEAEVGQTWTVEVFNDVTFVDVVGTTKGKGFAGVMKRHGFKGLGASHGTERKHRSPGSIAGHGSDLGHGGNIKKGKRMAGRMGGVQRTSRNRRLMGLDVENHLLLIKGSVPGPNGGVVFVRKSRTAAVGKT